jgi:rSAM/selenodomain-associated transferase 1
LADNRGVVESLPSLLLFARAPREGRAKTRLFPAVGASGAARLARAFLEDAARAYGPPAPWSPVLCADPTPEEPPFPEVFAPGWRRQPQTEGTLGERLASAFAAEFHRGARAVAAVGSDHPVLPRRGVAQVFDRLAAGWHACVIPAQDGGYCAIGLSAEAPATEAFRDVPWSSSAVLEITLARLERARCAVAVLDPSYDVDRPEDLERLAADLAGKDPSEPDFPRATAAALAALVNGGVR